MELRIGIEKYETNKYSIKSIEYIQGILHSFAELNEPNSNLVFEYEIVEFGKSENISETLKKRFYIFENQQIDLLDISKETFLDIFKVWFFNNGELRNLNISRDKQENQINDFFQLLEDILKVNKILKIENLKSENEKVHLELGIDYEYIILKCEETNYILYFTFWD